MLNIEDIRKEFPILDTQIYGKPLVYLDNAATTQKPKCVIDAISNVYATMNANVHRGIHHLSQVPGSFLLDFWPESECLCFHE